MTERRFNSIEIDGKKAISWDIEHFSIAGFLSDPLAHKLIHRIQDEEAFEFAFDKTLRKTFANDLFGLINQLIQMAEDQGFDVYCGLENEKRFRNLKINL